MLVMPFPSVFLISRTHVNTECDLLDSRFMLVSPTRLAADPVASRAATSFTAYGCTGIAASYVMFTH